MSWKISQRRAEHRVVQGKIEFGGRGNDMSYGCCDTRVGGYISA